MILGLGYTQQVGKDTVGAHLVAEHGFTRVAFADRVRDLALEIDPLIGGARLSDIVSWDGWEQAKRSQEVRRLLINIGVGAREVFGPNVWVNAAEQKVRALQTDPNFNGKIVITDVRFLNEVDWIRSFADNVLWYVRRPGSPPADEKSEQLNPQLFNRTVTNNGTLDKLYRRVDTLLAEAEEKLAWP